VSPDAPEIEVLRRGRWFASLPRALQDRIAQLSVLRQFRGEIDQVPPMYSALKRDGKPLYEYARQGIELERAPRRVTLHELRCLSFAGHAAEAEIEVACSKGTYVRTLAADIGEVLGCGAHLTALRRTRIGELGLAGAVTLERLEGLELAARDACLAPADALVAKLPCAELSGQEVARVLHGQAVRWNGAPGERWRLYGEGRFLGLASVTAEGWLQPKRLLAANFAAGS